MKYLLCARYCTKALTCINSDCHHTGKKKKKWDCWLLNLVFDIRKIHSRYNHS